MTNTDDMTNTDHVVSRAAFLKTEGEASKKVENVCKNRTVCSMAISQPSSLPAC